MRIVNYTLISELMSKKKLKIAEKKSELRFKGSERFPHLEFQ